jgi:hypothetical protein
MNESIDLPDKLPAPDNLAIVPGGRGQSFQSLGVKLQPRTSINYRVTAKERGIYTMPSFTIKAYGKPVKVPETRVAFVDPGTAGLKEAPKLIVEIPRDNYYAGQFVPVRAILLSPQEIPVHGISQVQIISSAFITDSTILRSKRELYTYQSRPVMAHVAETGFTPIMAGNHNFSLQAHATISRPIPNQPGAMSFFTQFFDSEPAQINILRLPKEGELPGFTGAIGSFRLEPPRLSTNDLGIGNPLLLTVTIKGQGNLAQLVAPRLQSLRDWQIFPPVSDPAPPYIVQQRGSAIFTYTMIPVSPQIKTTPAIPFSYFDPNKKEYVDLTIPPVPIQVRNVPGLSVNAAAAPIAETIPSSESDSTQERELALTGLNENPGKTASQLHPLQGQTWFLIIQLIPALALGLICGWDAFRRYQEQHPDVIIRWKARRRVRCHLKTMNQAAHGRQTGLFVQASINALREACAPSCVADPQALVCQDVLMQLPKTMQKGAEAAVVTKIFEVYDRQQYYAKPKFDEALLDMASEVEKIIYHLLK